MRLNKFRPDLWGALLVTVALGACNREPQVPVAESAATQAQSMNQPTTVKGCLRAGEAADTFVLTAEKAATGDQTATYQLQPSEGVALAEHVGRQVEVSGTVVAQQELTTQSSTQPADKSRGTSGTPAVSTTTELEIKKLNVGQVRRIDGSCPDND